MSMGKLFFKFGCLLFATVLIFALGSCGTTDNGDSGVKVSGEYINEAIVGSWVFEEAVPEGLNRTEMTFDADGTVYTRTFQNDEQFSEGAGTWVFNEATGFVVLNDDHNLSHRVEFYGDVMSWHHMATSRTAEFVKH